MVLFCLAAVAIFALSASTFMAFGWVGAVVAFLWWRFFRKPQHLSASAISDAVREVLVGTVVWPLGVFASVAMPASVIAIIVGTYSRPSVGSQSQYVDGALSVGLLFILWSFFRDAGRTWASLIGWTTYSIATASLMIALLGGATWTSHSWWLAAAIVGLVLVTWSEVRERTDRLVLQALSWAARALLVPGALASFRYALLDPRIEASWPFFSWLVCGFALALAANVGALVSHVSAGQRPRLWAFPKALFLRSLLAFALISTGVLAMRPISLDGCATGAAMRAPFAVNTLWADWFNTLFRFVPRTGLVPWREPPLKPSHTLTERLLHTKFERDGWPRADGVWEPHATSPLLVGVLDERLQKQLVHPVPFERGEGSLIDQWGRPYRFAYVPPGHAAASHCEDLSATGRILVWSIGPDGIDQLGCTTGACQRDDRALVRGEPSARPSDDFVVLSRSAVRIQGDAADHVLSKHLREMGRCGRVNNWHGW
jgi:hypothetical protein